MWLRSQQTEAFFFACSFFSGVLPKASSTILSIYCDSAVIQTQYLVMPIDGSSMTFSLTPYSDSNYQRLNFLRILCNSFTAFPVPILRIAFATSVLRFETFVDTRPVPRYSCWNTLLHSGPADPRMAHGPHLTGQMNLPLKILTVACGRYDGPIFVSARHGSRKTRMLGSSCGDRHSLLFTDCFSMR